MLRRVFVFAGAVVAAMNGILAAESSASTIATVDAFETATLDQTGITGPGQQLEGVGQITAIISGNGNSVVWTAGQNNVELVYAYTGYTSNVIVAPTAAQPGSISLTGGVTNYYVLPAGTGISTGSIAGDIAVIESGRLFLSTTAATEDSSGDTLLDTIPPNQNLNSFSDGSAFEFLDVTGGDAASDFNTNTFADAYDTANGGFADTSFSENFSTGSSQDGFSQAGSGTFVENAVAAVPEPSVAGTAAAALWFLARRKRSNAA